MRTTLLTLLLTPCAFAVDPHVDVLIVLPNGATQFTTGSYDFNNPSDPIVAGVRVFKGAFGEAGQPDFTDDPGYAAPSGSLPHNMLVGFDIAGAVRIWDGADFDAISPSTITCERFASSVTSPPGAGQTVPGFWLDTTGSSGGIHVHPSYYLDPPLTAGIYLLTVQLRTNSGSIANPPPIFIVFDNNNPGGESAHEAAVAYVESTLAPPACPGDITGDGRTNVADFNILASNFASPVPPHTNGDLTGDGFVNVADFNLLAGDFGCLP